MNTFNINIEVPEDIFLALNESEKEVKQRLKITLAIWLYTTRKLTIGKSAEVAGMSRLDFENVLADSKIPISNLSFGDIIDDISKLK